LWGGCAWINLDDSAPPLRECIEPFASKHDEWKVGALRTEWWESCLLPVNWKLATEAFMEGYHVPQTHPQLLPSSHTPDPSVHPIIETSLHFMRTLGSGMGGMTHDNDVRIAEGLQNMSLPKDPAEAMAAWRGAVNDAVTKWHRARGCDFPDLNDLDRRGVIDPIGFCFPHYFILPQYSSASSYRIRPLGLRRRFSRSGRSPATRATAHPEIRLHAITRGPSAREPVVPLEVERHATKP
jgi:hypothetical protein